jgi:hypothetical protein
VSQATGSSVSESCHARMAPRTQGGAGMTGHVCARRPRERGDGSGLNAGLGPKPGPRCAAQFSKTAPLPSRCLLEQARTASRATIKYISLIVIPAGAVAGRVRTR